MKLFLNSSYIVSRFFTFVVSPEGGSKTTIDDSEKNKKFVEETRASVSKYYGQELGSSNDLKTNACCTAGAPPTYIQDAIKNIHPEIISKYYGCGLCIPQYPLEGAKILDLGCGAGRDVYIASQFVGPTGKVVGVDMTDEQLAVAKKHQAYQAEKFGYDNVEFRKGYLEELGDLNLEPGSFDVIISNCVINLCTDKEAVLKECLNLLKPGGELYFSDVYSNRRIPKSLQEDQVMWGECLSGALYWNDFQNMAKKVGFSDPRLVEDSPIKLHNVDLEKLMAEKGHSGLKFYSATYRLWKLDLEPDNEDYGQVAMYKGTMNRFPSGWRLDKHRYFETGKFRLVGGNTYKMLHDTRLKEYFEFAGTGDRHYGKFGPGLPFDSPKTTPAKGSSVGGCC